MIRFSILGSFFASLILACTPECLTAQTSSSSSSGSEETKQIDPSGVWKWEQSFGGRSMERQVSLVFKDGKLTGTYGNPNPGNAEGRRRGFDTPAEIQKGKLVGDKISFDVTRKFGPNEFTTQFAGVISGDEIAGLTSVEFGGNTRESAWMAKRVSAAIPQPVVDKTAEAEATAQTENAASEASAANPAARTADLVVPGPTRIPNPGGGTDDPYVPKAILPGGIVMPLYPPNSPYLNTERVKEPEKYNLSGSVHGRINSIVNIHNPSIEVHFANPSMNTGAVVILAAGGGHRTLNVGTESADFVPFFYNYGVNTVILRNRLRSDGYEPETDAVRDAQQAIRMVRFYSEQWKFDPNRIGIMGFSAGAELSAPAAVQFESFDNKSGEEDGPFAKVSSRPDFVGIIYPGPTPFTRDPDTAIPKTTPPAFIASAGAGDRIHAIWATDYFSAMLKAGVPNVEMHIYGNGFHPGSRGATGGLTHRNGIPFGTWQDRFIDWFEDLGFLDEIGERTKAAIDSEEYATRPDSRRRGNR